MIILKTRDEIELMGRACAILKSVFQEVAPLMKEGTAARDIDRKVEDGIRRRGGRPAFKGYKGPDNIPFPASTCISIDAEVVHGMPGKRVFKSGQIIGLDIGVEYKGFYGDAARTFLIGEVSEKVKKLVQVTRESLYEGINQAREGNRLFDISHTIQTWVETRGYSVVRELSGHGIGRHLHEDPQIPNYGPAGRGPMLRNGMTLAIEPMINLGVKDVYTASDGWTVITSDGLPSAHWEETIVITDGDPMVLTRDDITIPD
ncbi:MAG: type I methionyl aminopeptidase [bacterium]|nr:type I methionyl aminopeptidase [bacterium]